MSYSVVKGPACSPALIAQFADLVQDHQVAALKRTHPTMAADLVTMHTKVTIIPRQKYTLVNVADSGKFMVENATGEIYGIKGYGKINRKHHYGSVHTTALYYWGEYHPTRLRGAHA
jgi:hypothetical protein